MIDYDDKLKQAWGMLEVMVLGVWVVLLAAVIFCVLWDSILTILRLVV